MLARPEVKRTYSRLKKEEVQEQKEPVEPKEAGITSTEQLTLTINHDHEHELSINKPDKMRKITDFFRVKRETSVSTSPVKSIEPPTCTISSPLSSVTAKLTQTYLDLGQKNLVSTQCPECLMHYNKSFADDVALHKKFHSQYLKGYTFTVDASKYRELSPAAEDILKWTRFRFYAIDKFDGAVLKKMEFFLNFVHVQLGAEPLSPEELKKPGKYSAIIAVEQGSGGRIVGMGLFEGCSKVYKSRVGCSESAIELEDLVNTETEMIGVSRIWVDSKLRSKGIASLVLDMKCSGNRDLVAFSQPTPAGFIFAKKYQRNIIGLDGKCCLIYL